MNEVAIETASPADLDALLEIENASFDYDVISARQMKYLLQSHSATVTKAVSMARTIGCMILLTRKNSRAMRVYSIGVLKESRHQGVGRKFLHYAERAGAGRGCDRIRLELHAGNMAALMFYLRSGFAVRGRRKHYYTDGSTALLLEKQITGGGLA